MALSIFQLPNLKRASLIAALAVVVSAGSFTGKAFAGDDEDTIDTKFVKGILGAIGLKSDEDAGIDYHERSPLVVPPTHDLPPPESSAAVLNNPAWPKDPDLTAKKKVKRVQRNAVDAELEDMRQLSPAEMNAARGKGTRVANGDQSPQTGTQTRGEQLTPSQLGHSGFTFDSLFGGRNGTEVKFEKEPERASLTDPPVGLRTPSSNYKYGTRGVLDKDKNSNDQAVFGVDK
jgi:hypothetical protein